MQIPDEVLNELVQRLVEAVKPARIILFGSAARGEMRQNSDLDVLIVVPDGTPHVETWNKAYLSLRRFPYPKDILIVTESDFAKHRDDTGLIYAQVLQEGRELYHAA